MPTNIFILTLSNCVTSSTLLNYCTSFHLIFISHLLQCCKVETAQETSLLCCLPSNTCLLIAPTTFDALLNLLFDFVNSFHSTTPMCFSFFALQIPCPSFCIHPKFYWPSSPASPSVSSCLICPLFPTDHPHSFPYCQSSPLASPHHLQTAPPIHTVGAFKLYSLL